MSFSEDSALSVYETSDPDWTLVGLNGEYGFAPANYIEIIGEAHPGSPPSALSPHTSQRAVEDEEPPTPSYEESPPQSPAAALAGIIHNQSVSTSDGRQHSSLANVGLPSRPPQYTPEASDEETPPPSLPQRPHSQQTSPPSTNFASPRSPGSPVIAASPPYNRATHQKPSAGNIEFASGSYHLYNISEMVSFLGKKKKMPTTLGLNTATGNIMIAPEKSKDGPQQEWTADKLTHYSIEGKHVFMELVRPSKSLDFHAGAKETAHEIVSALGDIAGAVRAEGLREVLAAGAGSRGGQKKGQLLYDFMAQGDDEVTVALGDEVIVIDDIKSEEWWMVRRLKNGKEGVVPSSYVEVTGTVPAAASSNSGLNAGRSTVEQNRLEEERLAKESARASRQGSGGVTKGSEEVGLGVKLPMRGSSLNGGDDNNVASSQRNKRESKPAARPTSTVPTANSSKFSTKAPSWSIIANTLGVEPDTARTRTWTDRSGSFKVEAEFIGLKDGKIHLHKLNGVKIAVPVVKMAVEDLEYVESKTGVSLDDEKPLADIQRRKTQTARGGDRKKSQPTSSSAPQSGASVGPKQPEYDWFEFFLGAGVSPYHCERYASNFNRDSMDESVLPDITPTVLRTLGLKEGDILRVMKYLDNKYNRISAKTKLRNVSFGDDETIDSGQDAENGTNGTAGGLFSGPGGTLRNNTRKGRPAPAVQTSDVVDAKAFQPKNAEDKTGPNRSEPASTPSIPVSPPESKPFDGFDDDAWDVKPSKQMPATSHPPPASAAPISNAPTQPTLTGSLADLSILSPALQPTIVHSTGAQPQPQSQPTAQFQSQPQPIPQQQQPGHRPLGLPSQAQPTGANPSFFSQLTQQQTGTSNQQINPPQGFPSQQDFPPQPTGFDSQPFQQINPQRQRPQAPQSTQSSSLIPPPPMRPLSAPQHMSQPSSFGPPPLQQQLTGYQNHSNPQIQVAPPGQSLNELNHMRFQQQNSQQQLQPQFQGQGYGRQNQSFGQYSNAVAPQQTGFGQLPQMQQQPTGMQPMQPYLIGQQTGSPFADPRPPRQSTSFQPMMPQGTGFQPPMPQSTGFQSSFHTPQAPYLQSQPTGSINSFLPPALQPQPTGANGFGGRPAFGQPPPAIPPLPQQSSVAPLQAQKTGPAPPVRFGVSGEAKKLLPQATGRRANLSQASEWGLSSKLSLINADTCCSTAESIWLLDKVPFSSRPAPSFPCGGISVGLQRSVLQALAEHMFTSS